MGGIPRIKSHPMRMSSSNNNIPQVGWNTSSESHPVITGCPTDSGGGNKTTSKVHAVSNQAVVLPKATGSDKTEENEVFTGRPKLPRTPPPAGGSQLKVIASDDRPRQNRNTNELPTKMRTVSVQRTPDRKSEGDLLGLCREIILKMKAATTRQKNISNDIKFGLVELEDAFDAFAHGLECSKQAEPQLRREILTQQVQLKENTPTTSGGGNKRTASSPAEENEEKRARGDTPASGWRTQEPRRLQRQQKNSRKETMTNPTTEGCATPNETTNRSATRTRKQGRIRPEALLIRPKEGQTFAEVVKEIRSKVRPEEAKAEVKTIRQTKAGDVLLELGPNTKNKEAFREVLCGVLGVGRTVCSLGGRVALEIRDLDSYTEQNEVEEALRRDIPGVEISKINVFPSSRGQKIAVIVVNERSAWQLINQGKIKVGWLFCRIRKRAVAARCFKCFAYGHVARSCNGPDRSKLCYKCLDPGHKAKECPREGCCVICKDKGVDEGNLAHMPGSGRCKVYREALKEAKNRLC